MGILKRGALCRIDHLDCNSVRGEGKLRDVGIDVEAEYRRPLWQIRLPNLERSPVLHADFE